MSPDTLTFIGTLMALVGVAVGVLIALLPTELTRKRDDYQNIAKIWILSGMISSKSESSALKKVKTLRNG